MKHTKIVTLIVFAFVGISPLFVSAHTVAEKSVKIIEGESNNSEPVFKSVVTRVALIQTNGFFFILKSDKTAEVTYDPVDVFQYKGDIVIPESVEYEGITYQVTSIGGSAFWYDKNLSSVEIPQSVTTIDHDAFGGCSGLASIVIPSSVNYIGGAAFVGCSDLATIIVSEENKYYDSRDNCNAIIETSSNKLIAGCKNTVIPPSVKSIESCAFSGCTGLVSVKLDNITSIGKRAFKGCSSLQSLSIANSITSIDKGAFEDCSGLSTLTIGNGLTSINEKVFYGCSSLTSVTIPNNVISIGEYAFCKCKNMTSVNIPSSVDSIGVGAFKYCSSLISVNVPNGVKDIGLSAFYGCKGLTSMTIPNSVESINSQTFYECSSLSSVSIPNGVTSIGKEAFRDCKSLTSVSIPSSLVSIGRDAFSGCNAMNSVLISDMKAWCNIIFDTENSNPIVNDLYLNGEKVTDLVIPEGVTSIGAYAFSCCECLTSITFPNSLTSIGHGAFQFCQNLTSLSIGSSVTSIDERAFWGCKGLISLTIPNSVRSIGKDAFRDSDLSTIISKMEEPFPFNWDHHLFYSYYYPTLYVPVGTKSKYMQTDGWKEFKNIIEGDGSNSDQQPTEQEVGDTFESHIDGALCHFMVTDGNHVTLLKDSELTGNVKIPETITYNGVEYIVTGIGDNAFTNCTTLTSLTIPASVTMIGEAALAGCTGLTAFVVAEGNQSFAVEDGVLYDKEKTTLVACPAGKSGDVKIPATVATIEANGFYNCSKLTSIELPSSLNKIKDAAFVGCSSLTTINIPASMNRYSIGLGAFTGCTNMESFTVSAGCEGYAAEDGVLFLLDAMELGTLSELVAYPNKKGDTYTVPSTVKIINSYAFCMTDIRDLTLPYMSQLAKYAIAYCPKLEKVTSTAAVPGWNNFETAFTGSTANATLYVPTGSKALYQATEGWKEFGDKIVEAGGDGDTYFVDGANNFYIITGSETVALVGINEGVENLSIPASASYNGKNYVVTDVGSGEEELSIVRFSLPKVKEINIPASVTKIGDWAFYQSLWKISTIEIPNTVKEIGNWAFSLNDHLESLTLNEGLEKIGEGAFSGCYNLRKVDIPSGVTSIGSSAFSSVDESVTIPATVKFIGRYAFQGYSPEKSLRVNISDLDAWCRIESDGGYWEEPVRFYNLYKDDSEVTEIVIPDGMTSISKVFHSCSNLSKVTIPSTVTDVNCAFYWCKNLQSVVNFSTAPQPIELYYVNSGTRGDDSVESFHTAFQFVEKNKCTLYVPQGSIITYSQAEGWRDFKNILEINGSAISCIVLDGEPFDVYSLQGHKILSGVTSLKGLPKGIYIVNGRKVIWQ